MRQIWWLVGKQKLFLHADAARYPISGCCQYVRFSSSNSNGPMANGWACSGQAASQDRCSGTVAGR